MRTLRLAVICAGLLAPALAWPEVKRAAPDGFTVEHRLPVTASPEEAWRVLVHPERWWPKDHTWSGDPGHLSLDANAGGCFCERWQDASVEHAKVIHVRPGRLLRMSGGLGPLQEMAVTGVLSVQLASDGSSSVATVTYRVSGDASHQLDALAPVVDRVIGEQFGLFATLASRARD
jgi:uncharacterized protein YndB with AHSA1/START domain